MPEFIFPGFVSAEESSEDSSTLKVTAECKKRFDMNPIAANIIPEKGNIDLFECGTARGKTTVVIDDYLESGC